MADVFQIVLRYLHILFGILWIGGAAYAVFVVRVAMQRMPPPARKEVVRHLSPVAIHYIPVAAVMTIAFGAILYLVLGGFSANLLVGTLWGQILLTALILASATFAFGMIVVVGGAKRMLAHVHEESCTHLEEMTALSRRFNRGQIVIVALGFGIIALMVLAPRIA